MGFIKKSSRSNTRDAGVKKGRSSFEGVSENQLEEHLAIARYGSFRLTDAVRPSYDLQVVPSAGWRRDAYVDDVARVKVPVIIAAQTREKLFDLFIDLHNPSARDTEPYFYIPPRDMLPEPGQRNLDLFLKTAREKITGPLRFTGKTIESGPQYDPQMWKFISKNWVARLGTSAATSPTFSINLSGQSLGDDAFLEHVLTEIESSKVDPRRVCFEITETAAIANLSAALRFMSALRGLGCRFILDDFGSGFSSFAYLKNLPVDFLKIDASFTHQLASDPIQRALVESIQQIGSVLGMKTIAEGIEDEETLAVVRELGVDYGQGFALDRPSPLDRVL